jgi:protein tyrosine phosphatase (PTP) superfamily phosphohydrolase (DUF442 family)
MLVMILLATSVLAGWRWMTGNVGIVEPGRIYRSAQLDADTLSRLIRDKGIRTVLNLRGPNPGAEWYPAERLASTQAGATQIDVPLASDYWLTPDQADGLVELLDTAERPMLIHCQFGAERTGLVSTMAVLLRPGATLDEARSQFSPYFLFLPTEDGLVMQGHLRQYEGWLARKGIEHAPEVFRRWIGNAYQPGTPNRSQWPYDPYPLLVVTPPETPPAEIQVTRRPAQGAQAR